MNSIRKNSLFLITPYWNMLVRTTWGDLKSRYAGSILGIGWTILTPFVLLMVYAIIYLVIFKVQVPNLSPVQYVLLIFSGLVPFLMTNEAITSAINSIVANQTILANTVFPVDLLPVKSVLSSQVSMVVGMLFIFVALVVTGALSWVILLLPFIWFLHIVAIIGVTWFLSLANLAVRDISNTVTLGLMAVMVVTPIAYTREMVPDNLKFILLINPLAYFVMAYQDIMIMGRIPEMGTLIFLAVLSLGLFWLGGWFFYRMKQAMLEYV